MGEGKILFSKRETRARLKVGRLRYSQLIESGILAPPIQLTDSARPVHTLSQIEIAENNLCRRALVSLKPANRKTRPLSKKLAAELRG